MTDVVDMAQVSGAHDPVRRPRRTWRDRLSSVDHKDVGLRYIVTAFLFFGLAGLESMVMRTQLSGPGRSVVGNQTYDELFTMHGVTMIFLFITPMFSGFGNYLIPLMIGSRDMAFPRLNALSFWVYLFSGLFLYSSVFAGAVPDAGWFNYVPLTGPRYSTGLGIDFYAIGLIFLGLSTTAGAVNFLVTILKLRAPGMSVNRMPLFVWAMAFTSLIIVFAIPSLTAANYLLSVDRLAGGAIFDPRAGGAPVLWQHLFWVFGHPDVYLIFLPAVGMVSTIVPVMARHRITGYTAIVLSNAAIAIISFGVWVHHMFTIGIPAVATGFFAAASVVIAVPSGIQIFAWLTTLLRGRPQWKSPLLFVAGFIVTFTIGGLSGVMFPMATFDEQVHDSYFLVAHFHYVLFGGAVFPLFAGLHYWIPKFSGPLLDEGTARWTFWLIFIGFNATFFPMHIAGLQGMPRRIATYQSTDPWEISNLISSVGAFVVALGILLFVVNVVRSLRGGAPAGRNPWSADTLEWATTSPPPTANFENLPVVRSRHPLWDVADGAELDHLDLPGHASLATSGIAARPEQILHMPGPSLAPLGLALSLTVTAVAVLTTSWWFAAAGVILVAVALGFWHRPQPAGDGRSEVAS